MIITVDTNIIFSGLVNTESAIGDLLINSDDFFKFYSCAYMRYEISKHWKKLLKVSKLSEEDLNESKYRLYRKINFIREDLIPTDLWKFAETVAANIDVDDIDFIAINEFFNAHLWTGDKELYNGLKNNGYIKVLNTSELIELRKMLR
jgi:predicted nucleic acid-binding protein